MLRKGKTQVKLDYKIAKEKHWSWGQTEAIIESLWSCKIWLKHLLKEFKRSSGWNSGTKSKVQKNDLIDFSVERWNQSKRCIYSLRVAWQRKICWRKCKNRCRHRLEKERNWGLWNDNQNIRRWYWKTEVCYFRSRNWEAKIEKRLWNGY